ncbi:transcription antitermination factor NusB [Catalinimonas niigatensis]|uniref:transcription antitermination factor NusB n=1 Tax=Catalinimonas niigatensis TaxID=1397264 RepID=UPI0026657854|nr:transcription antitermination factor NusB [Catalinimonas niigatensis]WPP53384.1 transcription antitermination factor NusB [Catalinimonas niigatensis]
MQHVYAYKQCQRSNYELAFQYVHDAYEPDLNSMEVQDKTKLAEERAVVLQLLEDYFQHQPLREAEEKYMEVAKEAISRYEKQCRKDQEFLLNQMISSTERIADHYRLLLLLLVEFADESHRDQLKQQTYASQPQLEVRTNFYLNKVIQAIRDSEVLQQETEERKLNWNNNKLEIRQWYKNNIKAEEEFKKYQALKTSGLEDDISIVRHVFNNIILKSDTIANFFEENDINWVENSKSIKSMVNKTIKSVSTESDEIEIVELTPNWEEDRDFLVDLYKITLQNDLEYEQIIREKSKNWAVDRIASLDSVVIKMAIAEMIHFRSIPVKVTINEYIDLSKNYSTHKSKQFVNGMLDVIAQELQSKNMIRKSGRGLIDNQ